MKKLLLILVVIFITSNFLIAQSFSLSTIDGAPFGDSYTVYGNPGAVDVQFEAILNNNSTNGANIKVLRNVIQLEDGASSYFKWVATYGPTTDLSTQSFFIPAGGSSEQGTFKSYYIPGGTIGVSKIEYTFFNVNNENENVKIIVIYDTSTDVIDENILKNTFISDIYPNPATNEVNIKYTIPGEVETASIKLVNLLGSVVEEQIIESGTNQVAIDISELVDGIYFYSVFLNNEMYITKKFIVN
jgi:type IX secretion system substrate protein